MKYINHKLTLLSLVVLALFSCKKDETKVIAQPGTAPGLAASPNAVVLSKDHQSDTAVTFTITPANFGYKAAISYTLEFAKPGTNFATPSTIQLTSNAAAQPVTARALNTAALNAGLDASSSTPAAQQLQVRLKADIGSGQTPVYSAPLTLTVTPYSLNSYLYVPGNYEGWSPSTAPQLISINSTGKYEGYANIADPAPQFKFTDSPDWNHGIYGDAGNGSTGTIASPGNNITLTGPGYYKLNVDLTQGGNTYTATPITWGVIGDFNGWSTDVNMVYNAVTQVWTATINVPSAGGFKFRANSGWSINFGDTGANGTLDYGGDNINISAGTHVVTLDLHTPGAYTYSIQ